MFSTPRHSLGVYRSVGVGCAGFFLGTVAWVLTDNAFALYAGVGVYWLGCLGMGVGYWASPVSIRDEFEKQLQWEATQLSSSVIAVVVLVGVPADVALSVTGTYTAPAAIRGAIWGYLLLIFIFGASHWYVKRQYERAQNVNNEITTSRERDGPSQGELAEAVGVSRQTINAIERDRYNPSLELAFKLASTVKSRICSSPTSSRSESDQFVLPADPAVYRRATTRGLSGVETRERSFFNGGHRIR